MQIGLGLVGLGKYIRYIPYPVVSGFMTAIGVIILVTQILPAVGYYPKEDQAFELQFETQAEECLKKISKMKPLMRKFYSRRILRKIIHNERYFCQKL